MLIDLRRAVNWEFVFRLIELSELFRWFGATKQVILK